MPWRETFKLEGRVWTEAMNFKANRMKTLKAEGRARSRSRIWSNQSITKIALSPRESPREIHVLVPSFFVIIFPQKRDEIEMIDARFQLKSCCRCRSENRRLSLYGRRLLPEQREKN